MNFSVLTVGLLVGFIFGFTIGTQVMVRSYRMQKTVVKITELKVAARRQMQGKNGKTAKEAIEYLTNFSPDLVDGLYENELNKVIDHLTHEKRTGL